MRVTIFSILFFLVAGDLYANDVVKRVDYLESQTLVMVEFIDKLFKCNRLKEEKISCQSEVIETYISKKIKWHDVNLGTRNALTDVKRFVFEQLCRKPAFCKNDIKDRLKILKNVEQYE